MRTFARSNDQAEIGAVAAVLPEHAHRTLDSGAPDEELVEQPVRISSCGRAVLNKVSAAAGSRIDTFVVDALCG